MGRGGIGGAAAMETADSTRAFVKDVRRVIIKVCIHTYIFCCFSRFFLSSSRLVGNAADAVRSDCSYRAAE